MKDPLRIALLTTISLTLMAAAVFLESPANSAFADSYADAGNDNRRRGRGSDDQNRNGNNNSNRSNSNRGNSNSNSNSGNSNANAGTTNVSRDRAREIALNHVPGDIVKEELKNRKGRRVYEFKIRKPDGALYEVKIDAADGSLVEIEKK